MHDDEFTVTMKTSLHRREAAPLVSEGYRILAQGCVAAGQRLQTQLHQRIAQFWPLPRKRSS
jgi:hypothetical protein